MKQLALAAGIVFMVAGILFAVLSATGLETAAAMPIAALPLNGIVYVHQTLEKGSIKPNLKALPRGVVSFQGFALPWYQLLVYGTFIFAAFKQLGGFIGGITAAMAGLPSPEALTVIAAVIGNLVAFIAVYSICVWIGSRSDKFPYLVGIAVPFFGSMLGAAVDYLVLSDAEFLSFFGQPKSIVFFVSGLLASTLITLPFVLLGIWRGTRARLSAYLSYLLGILPEDTRNSIIDLTYGEVKALASGPGMVERARA